MVLAGRKKLDAAIKGSIIISAGGLITKILGAVYRIPLIGILGTEGLGIYQTVFPLYTILLTFSSTGVPSAIAKIVSGQSGNGKDVLKSSLALFLPIGAIGFLLMAAAAMPLSTLQGEPKAFYAYLTLSPSVLLVSAISCLRGYFQGKKNMTPTATSQIIEQAVKLLIGLGLCSLIPTKPYLSVALATLAVTVSEVAALMYLIIKVKPRFKASDKINKYPIKRLIAAVIPITLSALLLPLSRVYDSFTVVNILGTYTENATSLYGIYTGGVESLIGVPVAVCYGVATAFLPTISSLVKNKDTLEANRRTMQALTITFVLSALAASAIYVFAEPSIDILYTKLDAGEKSITVRLLKAAAVSVAFLSLIQTETSCLIAFGKSYVPCVFLGLGLLLKFILQPILLGFSEINVFGALISDILCYFVAVFGNLVYIIIYTNKKGFKGQTYENNLGRYRNKQG